MNHPKPRRFFKEGAMAFSKNRSYVSTLQKDHLSIIEGLVQVVKGDLWMPNYPHNYQFEYLEISQI